MTDQDKVDEVTAKMNNHDPLEWFPPWRATKGGWRVTSIRGRGSYFFKLKKDADRFVHTGVSDD